LLKKFREQESDFSERFKIAQASDDAEAASRCAHTLKGVAGNVGATEVQQHAAALEIACHDNTATEEIDSQLESVVSALVIVMAGLAQLENNQAPDPKAQPETAIAEKPDDLIKQLRALLEDDDTQAAELLEELKQLSGLGTSGNELAALESAIADYDFDAALEALDKLEALLG
jgi:two-component system sensor histidine kinase/response regulator